RRRRAPRTGATRASSRPLPRTCWRRPTGTWRVGPAPAARCARSRIRHPIRCL
ncbi:hypothetical protein MyNCGM70_61100, partial [Achromobacter xylosoxidans]